MSWAWNGIKRSPLPPRNTAIRPISAKKRREQKQRRVIVAAASERDDGQCVARGVLESDCYGCTDCHEVIRRGQWRAGYLVLDNCLTLCRRHHEWVGSHPSEAVELGLAKWSWQR